MQLPENIFKTALQAGRHQLGLWCTLPGAYAAELLAGTGFDWLLFDTEHSPNDPIDVLAQLQAVAPYPVTAVVRPACNDTVLIKRMLDTGVQTLLIPYVQNEEEARQAVASTRYPPEGVRGVAGMTRASGFGRIPAYTRHAASQLCLLVQVETQESLNNLDSIIGVDGVDGVFIGPADLAASLGYPGELGHPEVVSAIETAILRIRQAGKPAGILSTDEAFAHRCKELGTLFTAVGVDAAVLARQAEALANRMRRGSDSTCSPVVRK